MQVRQRQTSAPRCPLCHDALTTDRTECAGCGTGYHGECLAELGGCGTLGCDEARDEAVEQLRIAEAAHERLTDELLEDMQARGPGPRYRVTTSPLAVKFGFSVVGGLVISWGLQQMLSNHGSLTSLVGMAVPIVLGLFLIANLEDRTPRS